MIVHRNDVLPFLDLQVVAVGRTVLIDVCHLVQARRIRNEIEAGVTCLQRLLIRRRSSADARVRRIELSDHHHHDRVQLFFVDEIVE